MKAVVLEIKGKEAAALSDDGCILKVKNKKYAIGQVIELKKTGRFSTKFVVWAASAAAAVVIFGTGAWAYFSPYKYVSLDVNPSIEYTVNRFDRVLSAAAVNEDGEAILQNLDLNNKSIDEAVQDTVNTIEEKGYFEGTDPGGIVISTSSDDQQDAEQLADELKTTAEEATKDTTTPVEVEAVSVGLARVQEARTLGTTPGKLNLVQKLQASSTAPDSINVEDWLKKPVKEILKAIKQNKKDAKAGTVSSAPSDSSSSSDSSTADSSASSSENSSTVTSTESSSVSSQAALTAQAKSSSQWKNNNGKSKTSSASVSSASSAFAESRTDNSSKVNGKSENAQQKSNNGKGNSKG